MEIPGGKKLLTSLLRKRHNRDCSKRQRDREKGKTFFRVAAHSIYLFASLFVMLSMEPRGVTMLAQCSPAAPHPQPMAVI